MSFLKTTAIQHLNGSTPAINLSANGNVGIGRTLPGAPLHVEGPTDDGLPIVRFNATTTTATPFQWISSCLASGMGTGQNFVHLFGKAQSTPNSGYIGYKHYADNSNLNSVTIGMFGSNNLLNVYGSGYVTKPYQPAFSARATGSGPSASGTILFNEIDNNVGSHYSASTGRFTAPIAGRYLFSHFVLFSVGGTNASLSAQIRKNGAAAVHPYTRSTGGDYVSTAGTVILSLSAGDYVTVFVDEGTIYATGAAHNNFSGFLIG